MQMTKSRLVLVLHLIGTSFLDQSQSVFKQTHCNPVFDRGVNFKILMQNADFLTYLENLEIRMSSNAKG